MYTHRNENAMTLGQHCGGKHMAMYIASMVAAMMVGATIGAVVLALCAAASNGWRS
jgi:hypothetical protein